MQQSILFQKLGGMGGRTMLYMDYHVHCQNSPDSSEPLEEICKGAVDAGINEIMITDHYEMFTDDFGRKAYQPEYFDLQSPFLQP